MRTFYKQILDRTYEIFGSRQTENMDEDQIVFLLNALENVSKMYAYIPEEQQKAIINKRMITDKDYKNINARLIAGWFEQDGKVFFQEVAHKPSDKPESKPLEGEERDKAIEIYLAAIANATTTFTTNMEQRKGNGARMREQLNSAGLDRSKDIIIEVKDLEQPKEISALEAHCISQSEDKPKEI